MQLQFKNTEIICTVMLYISAISFPLSSQAVTVQEVPNPRQVNNSWVTDNANILSDSTETQLNQMISDLEAKNGSEIAVVTVAETKPAPTPKAFATELFNFWKIGKKGKNNGVLFLISTGERRLEIETGSGIQKVLPDGKIVGIIQTEIAPKFKQQDFDGGTLAGTKALVTVLENPMVNAQSPTTLPLAPIVPSAGAKQSPIPSRSPAINSSISTSEDASNPINLLLLGLFIASISGWIIFKILRSLRSRKSPSPRHRRYQRHYSSNSPNSSSGTDDYSTNGIDYSSSNSPNYGCGADDYSTNGIDYSSSNSPNYGCGADDYSSNSTSSSDDYSLSSSNCGASFGGGSSIGGGGGGDYSSSSSSSDYSSSSSSDYSSSSSSDSSSSSSDSSSSSGWDW